MESNAVALCFPRLMFFLFFSARIMPGSRPTAKNKTNRWKITRIWSRVCGVSSAQILSEMYDATGSSHSEFENIWFRVHEKTSFKKTNVSRKREHHFFHRSRRAFCSGQKSHAF